MGDGPYPRQLRALIVDDNAGQRRLLGQVLKAFGATTDFAHDGREAVAATGDVQYDLILMDVSMPWMDGLCATRLIRERERAQDARPTPLYIITSHDDDEHRLAAHEAGANGHIPKPTPIARLFDAMQSCFEVEVA